MDDYKIEYVTKLNADFSFSSSNNVIKIKEQYKGNQNMVEEAVIAREYYTDMVNKTRLSGEKVRPSKIKSEALAYAKSKMKEKLGEAGYQSSVQPSVSKTVESISKKVETSSKSDDVENNLRQEYDDLILANEFDVVYENKYRLENIIGSVVKEEGTPFDVEENTFNEVFENDLSVFDMEFDI